MGTTAVPLYSSGFSWGDFELMLQGASITLVLTLLSGAAGTVLGVFVGWARTLERWYITYPLVAYIDVIRSVPLIIQFILFNSVFAILGFRISPFWSGMLTLSLYIGGYVAEVVKAGIDSVPRNTRRAARGLGMSYFQDLRYVTLPIGVKAVFPAWIGLMLGLMKDTSLIAVLGATPPELLRASQIIINRIQEPLLILLGAGVFYFIMCAVISRLGGRVEARWAVERGIVR